VLLQYANDLLFRVPALLHHASSRLHYERTPAFTGRVFRGQVNSKLRIPDCHLRKLPEQFAEFLRLTDFSK
jgi:hypothetical protein